MTEKEKKEHSEEEDEKFERENVGSEDKDNCKEKDEKKEGKNEIEDEEKTVEEDMEFDRDLDELERDELIEHINNLEEKLAYLEEEKDGYHKKLQRLQADFVNYRERSKREKEKIALKANVELIDELLPVIDNFERALVSEGNDNNFKTGVEMIYKQLMNNFKKQGLKKIPTEGESFDHKYHEAIMQVEDSDKESGIIVEEMQKGYVLDDKVIRPAMVKVAK